MKIYQPHAAAKVFPPLRPAEMENLKRSILERGQVHRAVLLEGKLLDGRNRQEAIRQLVAEKKLPASTELRVEEWRDQGGSPVGFADATNDKRRHLTESQRSMIATKLLPMFRKEAKERQAEATKLANRRRARGQKTLPLPAPGRKTAAQEAARAAGGKVSARSVERAAFVQKKDPELASRVFEGEMTVKQAERKIRLRTQVAQASVYVPPRGEYSVIVADPAWEFDDELNGSLNRGLPYPTMSIEEICALTLPAASDCALFLWTTKTHLLNGDAVRACNAWGFKAKTIITWVKSNVGLGRYVRNRCEFVIIATKGHPAFALEGGDQSLKDDIIVQAGPRLPHSEKPDELFARAVALCPCPDEARIELFARKPRAGWVTSGSELAYPAPAGAAASQNEVPPTGPRSPNDAAAGSLPEPTPESLMAVPDDQMPFVVPPEAEN
jgi:N6-adenosine-specific RNA methylase IME4